MKDLSWLIKNPIAHRGLHDGNEAIYENSLTAFRLAIENSFAIECDLHFSNDKIPFVFHDDSLRRLTKIKADSRQYSMEQLSKIQLGDTQDKIPSLKALLDLTANRVPLILELKGDKKNDSGFVKAVVDQLKSYEGRAALMSFDHWLVEDMAKYCQNIPFGLTAEGDDSRYEIHKSLYEKTKFDFMSYDVNALPLKIVSEMRETHKMPIITWTVRNKAQQALTKQHADQITFECMNPN